MGSACSASVHNHGGDSSCALVHPTTELRSVITHVNAGAVHIWTSGEPPGKKPIGRVSLSEARTDQLTLDHAPCGAEGLADDLFFADDLVILG